MATNSSPAAAALTDAAYEQVDFQSPVATLWVVLVLVLIGAGLILHAWWRRRSHLRFTSRTGRNADMRLLGDARVERWVGVGVLAVAVVLGGFAAAGALQTHQNVRSNLEAKYGVTEVADATWSGAFLTADLTLADGTVERDAVVYFRPTGEPLMGEDVFSPGGGL